jgi:hypothetical protein
MGLLVKRLLERFPQSSVRRRKEHRSDEFEMYPRWVPGVDSAGGSLRISLKALLIAAFDQRASWPTKVRNVSRLGSHSFFSAIYTRFLASSVPMLYGC